MSEITINKFKNTAEKMTLDQFRRENETNTDKSFKISCLKCDSEDVIFESDFDYAQGSEYTGIYGETTTILLKCKNCGNAWSVEKYH